MRIKSWNMKIEITKSRRDGTLLTVGFNLRSRMTVRLSPSPAGTALCTCDICRPCGTWRSCAVIPNRRLKPTVNKMSSLRDFAAPSLWEYPQYSTLDSHE